MIFSSEARNIIINDYVVKKKKRSDAILVECKMTKDREGKIAGGKIKKEKDKKKGKN